MKNIEEYVDFALPKGYEVTWALRTPPVPTFFMLSVSDSLIKMGVNRIRFADTVGVFPPSRKDLLLNDVVLLLMAR